MKTKIIASGSYTPRHRVTNQDFEKIFDTSDAWIQSRTGIVSRYYESTSNVNMALNAARNALETLDRETIDCIIVGTYTPDTLIPGVANTVRKELGITRNIPAFDVNAACSGFIYALHVAHAYIQSKMYKRILVIGSDFNSRILNFEDRSSSILFGDGAGAVVVEAGNTGILSFQIHGENDVSNALTLRSNNDGQSPFMIRDYHHDEKFEMQGRDVYKFAVRALQSSIESVVKEANLKINAIDYIVSHQANQRILDAAIKNMNLDPGKVLSNVGSYGNTSSGSVPLLFDESMRKGILKKGMKIIMVAFGGGLTYGACCLEI